MLSLQVRMVMPIEIIGIIILDRGRYVLYCFFELNDDSLMIGGIHKLLFEIL